MRGITDPKDYLEFLTGPFSSRSVAELLGDTAVVREHKRALDLSEQVVGWDKFSGVSKFARDHAQGLGWLDSRRSLTDMVESITGANAHSGLLKSLGLAPTETQRMGSQLTLQEYADTLDVASKIKKMGLGLYDDSLIEQWRTKSAGMASIKKSAFDAFAAITTPSASERASDGAKWINQLTKSLAEEDLYRRFLGTLDIRNTVPMEMWPSVTEAAKHRYDNLFAASTDWLVHMQHLRQPDYLRSVLTVLEGDVAASLQDEGYHTFDGPDNDEVLLQELVNADSPNHFAEIFSRCSPWLKWAFLNLVLLLMFDLAKGVAGNLITPYVERYLQGTPAASQTQKIKEIKKLSMGELGVQLRDYRFSTAEVLIIRKSPNSRAPKAGELRFGQVVALTSVQRDWSEVIYEYGDGQMISGWVFTRYLEKFRQ